MAIGSLAFRIACADAYRRTRETIGAITAYLQETLSGIRVVRSFAQEPRHRARFAELNDANREANLVTVKLNAAYFPAVEFVSAVATVGILLVGGRQVIDGDIEIGVLVGFIAALNGFFDPIGQLSQVYTTYQSGMAALDKIFELLDEQPDLIDAPTRIELERIRGEIRFEDVSFRYRTGDGTKLALDDVSLRRPARPDRRARRRDRRGQVDVRQARRALLRPDRRPRARRRPRPARRGARGRCARRWGSCPRRPSCSAGRSPTTSPSAARTPTRREIEAAARAVGAWDFIAALPDGLRHRGRRARRAALGRPAPAARLRPRAHRRPAHPRPRRGDLERRPAHRGPHRGRACGACSPGAPRSSSPTACRRSARPGGSSSSTRAGSSSRAPTTSSSRPTARTRRCTPTGRSRRRRDRASTPSGPPRRTTPSAWWRSRSRASSPTARSRPRAGRRRRPPTEAERLRGAARRRPRLVPRRRARRRARRPRGLPARRPALLRAGRRSGGWRTSASSSSRAAHWGTGLAQRLHAAALDEARARGFTAMRLFTPGRPGPGAALLRARGLVARPPARLRRAHRPRDRRVPPRALSALTRAGRGASPRPRRRRDR